VIVLFATVALAAPEADRMSNIPVKIYLVRAIHLHMELESFQAISM
jgi:sRNA-binding regulator protein Hfq